MQPAFSIVTITLNCADAAVRTAQSVLAQTAQNYEYIVKDGVSTDNTVDALRQLGGSRIIVSPDAGIYDAMNQSLKFCSGKYVFFLNAGDTFYSNEVLQRICAEMKSGAAIIYGNVNLSPFDQVLEYPSKLSRYFLFRKTLCHQAWFAQLTTYISLGGFNSDYRHIADQEFLLRAILKHNLAVQHVKCTVANFAYGGASTYARRQMDEERRHAMAQFYSPWEAVAFSLIGLHFLRPLKRRLVERSRTRRVGSKSDF
jgi:glycosyltransferase involved in cell wall biosynthesis